MRVTIIISLLAVIAISEGRFVDKSFKVSEGWEELFFGGFRDPRTGMSQTSSVDTKIIGGSNANPGEFPWQVSMQLIDGGSRYHICGGSILSSNKIATAAHCCAGQSASNLVVVAGAHDIRTTETTQQAASVSRIVMHPSYTASSYNFDACKLFLNSPLTLNSRVATIKLCTSEATSGTCTTTGWGTTSTSGNVIPPQLQKVSLAIIPRATCALNYSEVNTITSAMICAGGTSGKGGCNGDSGGPIVCNGCLAGATSWGKEPCGQPNFPTVYTNVALADLNSFYSSN